MIDRLIEIGRCYGMEINVEETEIKRISRKPSLMQITIDQRQPENVDYIKYLGSMISNDEKCNMNLNTELPWQKQLSIRSPI
jgi:hypothetical protein